MVTNNGKTSPTFKQAADDLVNTLQQAVHGNELAPTDRAWLIGELDELIQDLKNAKAKQKKAVKKKAA